MAHRLEQQLDGDEAGEQAGIGFVLDAADIKAGAQRATGAAQHQQAHGGVIGPGDGLAQGGDEGGIQRVAAIGPVQRNGEYAVGEVEVGEAHAWTIGMDHGFGTVSAE